MLNQIEVINNCKNIIKDLEQVFQCSCESGIASCLRKLKNLIPGIQSSDDLFSLLKKTKGLYKEKKVKLSIVIDLSRIDKISILLDSILNQSLKEIEIVLLDYGIKKKNSENLNTTFLDDNRIRLVSLKEKDLSSQKDIILPHLNGEYVLYINSNFKILPDYCEFIYLYSKIYNSDSRHFAQKSKKEEKTASTLSFDLKEFIPVFRPYEVAENLPKCLTDIAQNLYRRKIIFKNTDFTKKDNDVCLVIIYNHNYEANIEKLEKIYKDRFHHIFHLMPFYTGKKENVIPVYQSSYQFCDYVRQGLPYFYNEKFSHYVFMADDLVINPLLNDQNIISSLFANDKNVCFTSCYRTLTKDDILKWCFALKTLDAFLNNPGCHFLNFLPSYESACHIMKGHGIETEALPVDFVKKCLQKSHKEFTNHYIEKISEKDFKEIKQASEKKEFVYPLAMGFSDFFILPKENIHEVCQYFGILSSAGVFTEVAIPTTLLLNFKKVYRPQDMGLKILAPQKKEDREEVINKKYDFDFEKLCNSFDEDLLFVHPVKLSKWKMKE